MPQTVSTILNARWIVPIEPEGQVLEHYALVIDNGRILDLLPQAQVAIKYAAASSLDFPQHVLLPGLVNAHTHASMTLLRGLADDLPLLTWLQQHIWPAEARWVSPEFVADGTRLAIAELLRGGVTCFNDMYFFPEASAAVVRETGIRACLGLIAVDFPTKYAASFEEYVDKGLLLHQQLQTHPLLHSAFAPHAVYTVSTPRLERIGQLAQDLNLPVHIHLHETAEEVARFVEQHGCRPLQLLAQLGLVSPHLMAVHMTQLEAAEIAMLAQHGAHVVHCPESNLKLASGFCPTVQLDVAGVHVALGTDGAASNNDLDMFVEMRLAALLGKGLSGDAAALPAPRILRMATLHGAQALGIAAETGSLTPGKAADVIAVDLGAAETEPVYHPLSALVYAASRQQVTDVWVAGRQLLAQRQLTSIDLAATLRHTRAWRERILPN